jgi:hypothetical protein
MTSVAPNRDQVADFDTRALLQKHRAFLAQQANEAAQVEKSNQLARAAQQAKEQRERTRCLNIARVRVLNVLLQHHAGVVTIVLSKKELTAHPDVRNKAIAEAVTRLVFKQIHNPGEELGSAKAAQELITDTIALSLKDKRAPIRAHQTGLLIGEIRVYAATSRAKPRSSDGRPDKRIERMRMAQRLRSAS